jgi:hypothetical protein
MNMPAEQLKPQASETAAISTDDSKASNADPKNLKATKSSGFLSFRSDPNPAFDPNEVNALIRYASEHGIDDGLVARLYRDVASFRQTDTVADGELVLGGYTKLCALTKPITGRNVLNAGDLMKQTKGFMLTTFLIFVISIFSLAAGVWIKNEPLPDEGYFGISGVVVQHYLPFFTPFVWGALGACVFILKKINDEAASLTFDSFMFKGWLTRALLGAVVGGTVTYVIEPEAFAAVGVSSMAIAFLAGLGTKAVYGGFEKIIELMVEKMNLQSLKQDTKKTDPIAAFLAAEIAQTDPKEEAEKYKVLVTLVESRTQKEVPAP